MGTAELMYLGYDPGLTASGIVIVARIPNGYRCVHKQTVRKKSGEPLHVSLERIGSALGLAIVKHRPAGLTYESQLAVQAGKSKKREMNSNNGKTLMCVGVAIGTALAMGVPIVDRAPQQVKIAVLGPGNGNAEKKQVQKMAQKILGLTLTQDEADAAAAAICGLQAPRTIL